MINSTKGINTEMPAEMREKYLSACSEGHTKEETVCRNCGHVFCMNCSPSWSGQSGTHIECPYCGYYEEF